MTQGHRILDIFQDNKYLFSDIQRSGCLFLDCCSIHQLFTPYFYTPSAINKAYHEAIKEKFIVKDRTDQYIVSDIPGLLNFLFDFAGTHRGIAHTGNDRTHNVRTDATIIIYDTPFAEFGGEHYKHGDEYGNVLYDSMQGRLDSQIQFREFLRFSII